MRHCLSVAVTILPSSISIYFSFVALDHPAHSRYAQLSMIMRTSLTADHRLLFFFLFSIIVWLPDHPSPSSSSTQTLSRPPVPQPVFHSDPIQMLPLHLLIIRAYSLLSAPYTILHVDLFQLLVPNLPHTIQPI